MLLLESGLTPPHFNTEVPMWEFLVTVGTGIYFIIKLGFRTNAVEQEVTILKASLEQNRLTAQTALETLRKECNDSLDKHEKARDEQTRQLNELTRTMSHSLVKLETTVGFLAETVGKFTDVATLINGKAKN